MKIYLVSFILIIIMLVAGCGQDKTISQSPNTGQRQGQVNQQQDQQASSNDAVETDNAQKVLLNLLEIANKSPDEVAGIIGQPAQSLTPLQPNGTFHSLTGQEYKAVKGFYSTKDFDLEILYLDNKAGRITITPKDTWKYDQDVIKLWTALGLPKADWPPKRGATGLHWEDSVPNISEITFFKKDIKTEETNIEYVYVITDKLYK